MERFEFEVFIAIAFLAVHVGVGARADAGHGLAVPRAARPGVGGIVDIPLHHALVIAIAVAIRIGNGADPGSGAGGAARSARAVVICGTVEIPLVIGLSGDGTERASGVGIEVPHRGIKIRPCLGDARRIDDLGIFIDQLADLSTRARAIGAYQGKDFAAAIAVFPGDVGVS